MMHIEKHVTFHPYSNQFWDFFGKYGHLNTNSIYGDLSVLTSRVWMIFWCFSKKKKKNIFEEFEIFRLILMHFKFGLNFPLLPDAWVDLLQERVSGYLHSAVIIFTTFWFLFTRFSMSIAQYPTLSYLFFMYHNYLCFLRIVAIKEIKLPLQSQDQNVFPTAICNLIGSKKIIWWVKNDILFPCLTNYHSVSHRRKGHFWAHLNNFIIAFDYLSSKRGRGAHSVVLLNPIHRLYSDILHMESRKWCHISNKIQGDTFYPISFKN